MSNLFHDAPRELPEELVTLLAHGAGVRIERIVSTGHTSPPGFWYDQPEHEWVVVLRGAAKLDLVDRTVELRAGDYLLIPAHQRHRVAWTTPNEATIWLAVFFPHA